jgi:hypothetical protein
MSGVTVNVGGGAEVSRSLRETTDPCRELTGRFVRVQATDQRWPGSLRIKISASRDGSLTVSSHARAREEVSISQR